MTAVLEREEDLALEKKALSVVDQANALKILDQTTYDFAAEKFKGVSLLEKEIQGHYKPLKDKAFQSHRAICDAEKSVLAPVQQAKQILSRSIGAWDTEQERIRREEQRRLEEEARRQAEEEAQRIALAAIDDGASEEEVESIIQEVKSAPLPMVHAQPTYAKSSGVFTRETWYVEEVSLAALIKAAAANPAAYQQFLMLNLPAANSAAGNQKSAFSVPGLIAKSDRGAVSKGR